jgi:hypothetical protein
VTVVLSGEVLVEHDGGSITVRPGEAVLARAGERVPLLDAARRRVSRDLRTRLQPGERSPRSLRLLRLRDGQRVARTTSARRRTAGSTADSCTRP